jgi:hypothetical protein
MIDLSIAVPLRSTGKLASSLKFLRFLSVQDENKLAGEFGLKARSLSSSGGRQSSATRMQKASE